MLFPGEDGVKRVRVLSGGEKVRCLLSKMMISGANVLILDEPTDHLDMESITALNNGMKKFPGVLLFSSRAHQIVETTANRIMEILPGGKMIDKITTYDEYLASDATAAKRQAILDLNTEEQENEEKLFNLHNHLIWHSYRPFEDALTDAIFSAVIQKIIEDYNLTPQDVPADYRDLLE